MIKNKKKSGFTLVEVVLILIMISIGLTAIMSLALKSAGLNGVKKNMFNAMFLADEGLELMNNIRDTNIITNNYYNNWDLAGVPSSGDQDFYKVDYESAYASAVTRINDAPLWQDASGFYSHTTSSTSTIFSRLIMVKTYDDYSQITSWVRWIGKGENYDFKLETILYDLSF